MRFTLVVRGAETNNVITHTEEFRGEGAAARAQVALNALYDGWVIKGGAELIVMTLSKIL